MRIIDKYKLHPIGGYCTCFSQKYTECKICSAVAALQERRKQVLPEEEAQLQREYNLLYPKTYDSDEPGR